MDATAVVINLKGGTAMGMTREGIEAKFKAALGETIALRLAHGGDLPDVMRDAFADDAFDRIIVAGGDGTASLAASNAARTGKPFGIVPLGTMNLFARTIAMPLDLDDALAALARAEVSAVDCGELNGAIFVNHVSLGFHPQLIRMRDAIPRGSRMKRMWNGAKVYLRLMARHRKLRVTLTGDFPSFGAKAGLVVVSVNPIAEGAAQIPHPDGQSDGHFGVYVSTHRSAWDLNKVVWRLLNGTLRESEHIAIRQTQSLRITLPSAAHMSVDGEVMVGRSPLEFKLRSGGIRVLLPRPSEPSAEAD